MRVVTRKFWENVKHVVIIVKSVMELNVKNVKVDILKNKGFVNSHAVKALSLIKIIEIFVRSVEKDRSLGIVETR